MAKPSEIVLETEGLSAGYGKAMVVRDAALSVRAGEIVGLLGRNGAGKTTFINAIAGLAARTGGVIRLGGTDIMPLAPHRRVAAGLALCPSNGRLFRSLTVRENLLIGLPRYQDDELVPVLSLFPELSPLLDRYAGRLSGGERQMVAIGRAMLLKPRLLLLDEPSEGLAPVIVLRLAEAIGKLREQGLAALVAEQNVKFADLICSRRYSIEKGEISPVS